MAALLFLLAAPAAPAPAPVTDKGLKSPAPPAAVASKAFEQFRQGLATGNWEPFLALLTEDFTFFFPTGKWQGLHRGKAEAREFFTYVASIFPEGIRVVSVERVSVHETGAVFEFKDEGSLVLAGETRDYKNRVAVSFDVRGDKVAGYREYFGSDGKSY
jgi:ketosteroid isomerase-like protein